MSFLMISQTTSAIAGAVGFTSSVVANAAASGGGGDALIAPAGGAVVAAGLILQAARTYREARNTDVEGAQEQANRMKVRAEAAEFDRDETVARLEGRLKATEDSVAELRRAKDTEIEGLRTELNGERLKVYKRDMALAEHGIQPPAD